VPANDTTDIEAVVATLSTEERALLTSALRKVEWELYQRVLKRLRVWLAITASALAIFGVGTFATLRTAVVEASANKLAADADLRNQVVAGAAKKLERVDAIVASADDLQREVDAERGRALAVVRADLSQILKMTAQLQRDISGAGPDGNPVVRKAP